MHNICYDYAQLNYLLVADCERIRSTFSMDRFFLTDEAVYGPSTARNFDDRAFLLRSVNYASVWLDTQSRRKSKSQLQGVDDFFTTRDPPTSRDRPPPSQSSRDRPSSLPPLWQHVLPLLRPPPPLLLLHTPPPLLLLRQHYS